MLPRGARPTRAATPTRAYPAFANLYLYNWENLDAHQGRRGPGRLRAAGVQLRGRRRASACRRWATPTTTTSTAPRPYVFCFISPEVVQSGYGLTTTQIHEVGHHLGMSHPHDGYDSETGVDYGPRQRVPLRQRRRREQLDDELHRRELGLQPVRPGQQRPVPDRGVQRGREPPGRRRAGRAEGRQGQGRSCTRPTCCSALATKAFARHDYRAAYAFAEQAYNQTVSAARKAGVDAAKPARAMAAEADAARRTTDVHNPHEFIDTLAPDSPRAQP